MIPQYKKVLALTPKIEGITEYKGYSNSDIIQTMIKQHPKAVVQAKNYARLFDRGNAEKTAQALHGFCRLYFDYEKDPEGEQNIATPAVIIRRKNNDCKANSIFICSALHALGYECGYKFASYKHNDKTPSHVYCVTYDYKGNEIPVDGTANQFNWEKPYFYSKIYPMKVQSISDNISGINANASKRKVNDTLTESIKAYTIDKKAKKDKKTNFLKRTKGQKAATTVAKVANYLPLMAGRGAFLAILALNVNGLATKLNSVLNKMPKDKNAIVAWTNNRKKILDLWRKLGGFSKFLFKTIDKGIKKRPIFLSKKAKAKYEKRFGTLPPKKGINTEISGGPLAAVAAAAVPVLASLIPVILKALKENPDKESQEMANELADTAQDVVNKEFSGIKNDEITTQEVPSFEDTQLVPDNKLMEIQETIIEGINESVYTEGINGQDWSAIGQALGQVAAVGIGKAADAIKKKRAAKGKPSKGLEAVRTVGDDYVTGAYLRVSGNKQIATDLLQGAQFTKQTFMNNLPLLVLGGVAAVSLLGKRK